ncbi:NAD(P)H-dependent oxidoreductase [Streptomyces sp. NBC_01142]|uniref:NADPH-dependent FMN reductase n=1 Tax=Streptomyces sp. NBC_01142 TaxID=2975865 RepID=UPI002255C50C|nr:NAD(P)H-dependent oxidoreductase [Streptomyces sp. NBC_01142]MCX4822916.1 NAD(P)H-dependent oxidoreductase [Streptomyces sp. NBC_01142]
MDTTPQENTQEITQESTGETIPSAAESAPESIPEGTRESPATAPLKLAVILSSNREGRFGPVISDWFLSRVAERDDFTVELVDLAASELPSALSFRPTPEVQAELAKVSPKLEDADAFAVITPEYNHSFPASLKSLIDWHFGEWQAKPVGFISYGGMSGGLRAVEQLRQVFAEMHAVTVRDTVSFHNAATHFDSNGQHKDPAAPDAAAKAMLDQIAWWGHALRNAKSTHPYAG